MDKKFTKYIVRRTNPLIWLAAILMLFSAVVRVIFYSGESAVSAFVWIFYILLPVTANIAFLLTLILSGWNRIHMTSVPVWLGCVFFALKALEFELLHAVLCILLYLLVGTLYALTVRGRLSTQWLLVPLFAIPLFYHLYILDWPKYAEGTLTLRQWLLEISVLCIMLALLCTALSLRKAPYTGEYQLRPGDRIDGRRLRSVDPYTRVAGYIMPSRIGSSNVIFDKIEVTEMEKYVRQKRKEGLSHFGLQHVILAAYVRSVATLPAVNRFFSGQALYARPHVEVNMAVKKEMSTNSPDTTIKVLFDPGDSIYTIYKKFDERVEEVKNTPLDSGFDNTAAALSHVPGLFLKFICWLLKVFDYFGWLPMKLIQVSPFHGSFFITSMGSLGIPPIVHHLYDFGNVPVFMGFGAKRKENEVDEDGTVTVRKYVDYTFCTDERICDGYYYAQVLKTMRRIMKRPSVLDEPPEKVLQDVD